MSKRLAGFYGQKSFNSKPSPQAKPKEYIVLGINQPLIAPDSEPAASPETQRPALSEDGEPRPFWFSLLLNKLL